MRTCDECLSRTRSLCSRNPVVVGLPVLALIFSCKLSSPAYAEQSENHVALASAAEWAVITTNTVLLKALLDAGVQVNEHLDDNGSMLLKTAVILKNDRMVDFLLEKGADPELRDVLGSRMIDIAFEDGSTNICSLLGKAAKRNDKTADGMPCSMLEEVFRTVSLTNVVFVEVNRRPPSPSMLSFIRSAVFPNAQAMPEYLRKQYFNHDDNPIVLQEGEKAAAIFDVEIKKVTDDEYDVWTITFHSLPRTIAGELMEAIPIHYRVFKKYEYWVLYEYPKKKET